VDVAVTYQVSELSRADVVLTTYEAVRSSGAMLKRLDWHRVVLDECQEIRTATTQVARLCSGLHANHRWMVSGTPLASSIDDLHGELAFLDVWPFSLQKGKSPNRLAGTRRPLLECLRL
jgi:E3 ubiquitin-protein ligase SHPRH